MSRRVSALLLLLATAVPWGCGGSSSGPDRGAAGEAAAVRGLSPDWAVLSVPTAGGEATLHPPSNPARELWSGTASLPPIESAVRVAPRLLALRGPEGGVYRYDPAEDAVSRLGALAGEVRWYGGEDAGVWVRSDDGTATLWRLPGAAGSRRTVDREVRWAAPASDGATVALLGRGPATLVRWPRDGDESEAELELRAGPPAVVTAWGRMAAFTRSGESGVVQVVSLEEMAPVERFDVGGAITALEASPSSHELYVAVESPPRLIVVERISSEVRTRARFQRPIRAIRPGAAGGPPIVWDGSAAHLVPWGSGEPARLEGVTWRPDLPVSLSDGSVLAVRDGAVERMLVEDGTRLPSSSVDRLWIPVRWRAEAGGASDRAPAASDTVEGRTGQGTADSVAAPPDTGQRRGTTVDSTRLVPELQLRDAGFYVVVGWSRSLSGAEERLRPMREEGFPVAVQLRRDDAGRRWYRGLVGPYSERTRAEDVASTLQRDHGLAGRVQEVRPGELSDEVPR